MRRLALAVASALIGGAIARCDDVIVVRDGAVSHQHGLGDTRIVNRSRRPVRIETFEYGDGPRRRTGVIAIAPGDSATVWRVDAIGPDDPPGDAIATDSPRAIEVRRWLTWDR